MLKYPRWVKFLHNLTLLKVQDLSVCMSVCLSVCFVLTGCWRGDVIPQRNWEAWLVRQKSSLFFNVGIFFGGHTMFNGSMAASDIKNNRGNAFQVVESQWFKTFLLVQGILLHPHWPLSTPSMLPTSHFLLNFLFFSWVFGLGNYLNRHSLYFKHSVVNVHEEKYIQVFPTWILKNLQNL